MHACLAVTRHLHFWQNGRDLLRVTAVLTSDIRACFLLIPSDLLRHPRSAKGMDGCVGGGGWEVGGYCGGWWRVGGGGLLWWVGGSFLEVL